MLRGERMIPKKPAPDLIRGGHRFSEKIMLQRGLSRATATNNTIGAKPNQR
jgi:hypothetical protein